MLNSSFRMLLCLAVFASVSACATAVVGGAAAGGDQAGRYDYRSAGAARDAAISRTINAHYVKDPLVSAFDIHVDTHNGVVNLSGTVPSQQAARRAVSLAAAVDGVSRVISQLKIVPGETGQ
jgi:hyperosmotically inducible protein